MEEEEEEAVDLQQVMDRLDNLELQVGVIDSNVDEMRHEVRSMNQNLLAFFHSQNVFPPSSQGPPNEEVMNLYLEYYVLYKLVLYSLYYILL